MENVAAMDSGTALLIFMAVLFLGMPAVHLTVDFIFWILKLDSE